MTLEFGSEYFAVRKFVAILVLALAACNGGASGTHLIEPGNVAKAAHVAAPWSTKVAHVIIIFQENRSVDNLFNGLSGADTRAWGLNHLDRRVNLIQVSLTAPYDISHQFGSFKSEYNNGHMNGFDLAHSSTCLNTRVCPPANLRAYGIVPRSESKPYFDMAAEFGFGDRMFQTNEGPSFPAHQYIVSGTSTIANGSSLRAAGNARQRGYHYLRLGGCNSPKGTSVTLIDALGNLNRSTFPCFDRLSLMDLLQAKGIDWHYYQDDYGPDPWAGPGAIKDISSEPDYRRHVLAPSWRILSDIEGGRLPPVAWVTPTRFNSDHAKLTDGTGPSWVTAIVNSIGTSPSYWNDSVIFVVWDDWGGWYDHVPPRRYNSYELGFRVPLLVISPYAKKAYVSHTQHEFGSILKFIEETFDLGSLNTTDVRSDDLSDFFNFNQKPRGFVPIQAPVGPTSFLNKPASGPPDDDF